MASLSHIDSVGPPSKQPSAVYLIGQNVCSGFSVRCYRTGTSVTNMFSITSYRKTQMKFLANPMSEGLYTVEMKYIQTF